MNSTAAALEEIEVNVILGPLPGVTAVRYISAIGLTAVIWDHLLMFGVETNVVWTGSINIAKFLFAYLRYAVLGFQFFTAYALSGVSTHIPHNVCVVWAVSTAIIGFSVMGVANIILVMRVYALWDQRRGIIYALWAGFALTYSSAAACLVVVVNDLSKIVTYNPTLRTCLVPTRHPAWIGVWGSQIAFDIYVVTLTIVNAAERPRGPGSKIAQDLYRDGLLYFVFLFSFRLTNIVLCVFKNSAFAISGFCLDWAMVVVTICRLILTLEDMKPSLNDLSWHEICADANEMYALK